MSKGSQRIHIKGNFHNFPSTMSLGKLPGIKGLVSGSQGKRRFKSELSVDMISPPLGDFRHTMHVGRGGDVFGDTSFLSNHGGTRAPGSPDSASSSKTNGFFARTFRQGWKNSGPRPRGGSRDLSSPPPPDVSPIIKNAVSLPQLNLDAHNGCLLPSSVSSTDDSLCSYGEKTQQSTITEWLPPGQGRGRKQLITVAETGNDHSYYRVTFTGQ